MEQTTLANGTIKEDDVWAQADHTSYESSSYKKLQDIKKEDQELQEKIYDLILSTGKDIHILDDQVIQDIKKECRSWGRKRLIDKIISLSQKVFELEERKKICPQDR
jgi:vacuolar-type H+-ATPase subunit F/Vma7